MNSKRSLLVLAIGIVWFCAVIWGFAHGSNQETTGGQVAWVAGSLVFAALGVFLSYKVK